jgi:hypothetical protein
MVMMRLEKIKGRKEEKKKGFFPSLIGVKKENFKV